MSASHMTRRDFLKTTAGATGGAAAFGVVRSRATAADNELVVLGWGGHYEEAMNRAWYEPFTKATGIRIRQVSATGQTFSLLKAQVENNNPEYDVCAFTEGWVLRGARQKLLAPIDYNIVDAKQLYKEAIHPMGVALDLFAVAIGFNTEKYPVGKHPKTWAEYWDAKRFPGKRTAPGWSPRDNLEAAVMADDVPISKVYPIDVERAFKKLAEIKSHTAWYSSGAQLAQFLTDREAVLACGYSNRMEVLAQQGLPVAVELNQGILHQSWWVVSAVSRNKQNAMRFLNFAAQVEPQIKRSELHPVAPTNREAWARLPASLRARLPNYEMRGMLLGSPEWYDANEEKLLERWKVWLAS